MNQIEPLKPTHQLHLRCGAVAFAAQSKTAGEFCWLGNIAGEFHSWREDGRWAYEGVHAFDMLSNRPLKQ